MSVDRIRGKEAAAMLESRHSFKTEDGNVFDQRVDK
jgi:hypothetical protein